MQSQTATQKKNQQAVMHDALVGEIHDALMDENNNDLAHAFNHACTHIAELYRLIEKLENRVSSGYIRKK